MHQTVAIETTIMPENTYHDAGNRQLHNF